jgi:hypothetical protein
MNNLDTSSPTPNQTTPSVAARVLERIEVEHVTPRPRYTFVVRECLLWTLWVLTVLVGAAAVAVLLYVGMNATYAFYEVTHHNFLTFLFAVLPYLWLILLVVMAYVAVFGLRQTKRGYRYSVVALVGSSLIASLGGGALLYAFGFGHALDQLLGREIAQYMSMEKMELKLWQMPASGRMVGMVVPRPEVMTRDAKLQFKDSNGVYWTVSSTELTEYEMQLLLTKNRVRLLGTSTAPQVFHICAVFPWMFEKAMAQAEMEHERRLFEARIRDFTRLHDASDPASELVPQDKLCSHLEQMSKRGR